MKSVVVQIGLTALMAQCLFVDRLFAFQVVFAGQTVQISEGSFDKSNFGQLSQLAAKKKTEDLLEAQIALIDKAADLTGAQRSKLELAGQIDIHRFFSQYECVKRTITFGSIPRHEWQAQLTQMRQKIDPMMLQYAQGLHEESSLFGKTAAMTLDADQYASVRRLRQERAKSTYANYIRVTLAMIDRMVPLTQVQRSTISTLLLSKTDPPRSHGSSTMQLFGVLNQMGQIEDEIHQLFSEQEWNVISRLIKTAKAATSKQ